MSESQYRDRNRLEIFSSQAVAKPFFELVDVIMGPGRIPRPLKGEVFTVASLSAGCRHCQAHGAYGLHLRGTSTERIQALWDFERSPHFNESDRAALRLARDAGAVPNAVAAQHYEDLRRHFSDDQIRELLAVIALTGFLNRSPLSYGAHHGRTPFPAARSEPPRCLQGVSGDQQAAHRIS